MIDTISLQSPYISENIATIIESESVIRQGIDMRLGDILYTITTHELKGSYDSSLRIVVNRDKWVSSVCPVTNKTHTYKVSCEPYLSVECSVHKLILGHNCYGGTNDFHGLCKFLISFIEKNFAIKLPSYFDWEVRRVDYAECFDLGSFKSVQEWFRGINNAVYARRTPYRYGLSGTYFPGSTTAVKFYHKGVEFVKHDRKRLGLFLDIQELDKIQSYSNQLLRVEVEVKSRKLRNDFNFNPTVKDIKVEYLQSLYEIEVQRILKEVDSEMKIVRKAEEVEKRLYSLFSSAKAGSLLGTWYRFTTLGEDYTKENMNRATFYRHRKELKECGISWMNTDVVLLDTSVIPLGFTPSLRDSRRVEFTDLKISNALVS